MIEIAFATYRDVPELNSDDRLVAERLQLRGIHVHAVVWDDPTVDWSKYSAVLIRSTWDYHLRPVEYERWIRSFIDLAVPLWNSPQIVLSNLHKFYLRDLQAAGCEIIPTEFVSRGDQKSLGEILERRAWRQAVVKPAISAGSIGTWRATDSSLNQARFRQQNIKQDLLVQPFREEILNEGEWSLIFFAGRFCHAVLKSPVDQDFRVQTQFGGIAKPVEPPLWMINQAEYALTRLSEIQLYARVDGIRANDLFLLMEVELIEPYLYLQTSPQAVERFSDCLIQHLDH